VRVFLVRHGDKEPGDWRNPAIGGHQDNPLSPLGREEAERAAAWLAARAPGAIRASRYGRTSETARPLALRLGLEVVVDPLIDEIDVGVLDRMTEGEAAARYPEFWRAYQAFDADFRFPEGETGAEVALRAASFLDDARSRSVDVAAFSHDGFIRAAVCQVLGLPPYARRRFRADTAGITELEWDEGRERWSVARFNQKG
jgi:broad specificity phosphatase PhoE